MTAVPHVDAQLLDVARAGVDLRPAHIRAHEDRVREALAPRVVDLVTRRPSIDANLLENLIPGGNGVARLLAQQGVIERRGKCYFPAPGSEPKQLGNLRVNVAAANTRARGEALGERGILRAKLVQDFIDTHPGVRHEDLAAHFVGPKSKAPKLASALALLLNMKGIERTRRISDGAYRYWPPGHAPDDEPLAIAEKIPGLEDAAEGGRGGLRSTGAPPARVHGVDAGDARPRPRTVREVLDARRARSEGPPPIRAPARRALPTPPKEETPVHQSVTLDKPQTRNGAATTTTGRSNKVLGWLQAHPGGVTSKDAKDAFGNTGPVMLRSLVDSKRARRTGDNRKNFTYFPIGPLDEPPGRGKTRAASTSSATRPRARRAPTTSTRTSRTRTPRSTAAERTHEASLDDLGQLRQHLDDYAAHREAADEALSAYRELAARIGLHPEGAP